MKVTHDKKACRFNIMTEGYIGYVEYAIHDGKLDILHTVVPKEIGGKGIASLLVGTAYSYASKNGLEPAATCTYAAHWLEKQQYISKE